MNVIANPRPAIAKIAPERLDVSFTEPKPAAAGAQRALVYAVEPDRANAATLMTVVDGSRAKCEIFSNSVGLINALSRAAPDMIFLDVSTEGTDAVEALHALSQCAYPGVLQLMSNPGVLMVEPLRQLARLQSLQVATPLLKPLEISVLKNAVRDLAQRYRKRRCRNSTSKKRSATAGYNSGISRRSACATRHWLAWKPSCACSIRIRA